MRFVSSRKPSLPPLWIPGFEVNLQGESVLWNVLGTYDLVNTGVVDLA